MVGVGGAQRKTSTPLATATPSPAGGSGQPELGQRPLRSWPAPSRTRPRRDYWRDHLRQGLGANAVRHPVARAFRRQAEDDKLGLKLTTAQYLTPGDISIQGVGVTPDVELVRMRVEKKNDEVVDQSAKFHATATGIGLRVHLVSRVCARAPSPRRVVSYLYVPSAAEIATQGGIPDEIEVDSPDDEENDSAEPEEDRIDFPSRWPATCSPRRAPSRRLDLVSASKALLDKVRADEDKQPFGRSGEAGVD